MGRGLFADYHAALVREQYRDGLAQGEKPEALTRAMMAGWIAPTDKPGFPTVSMFWVALAQAQWETGWLSPRVKREALAVTRRPDALLKWRPAEEQPALLRALELLGAKLSKPPREGRMPRPRKRMVRRDFDLPAPDCGSTVVCTDSTPDANKGPWTTTVTIHAIRGQGVVFTARCPMTDLAMRWKNGRALIIYVPPRMKARVRSFGVRSFPIGGRMFRVELRV